MSLIGAYVVIGGCAMIVWSIANRKRINAEVRERRLIGKMTPRPTTFLMMMLVYLAWPLFAVLALTSRGSR